MEKKNKRLVGLSLVIAAITMTCSFIVLCFKKKNVLSAILALAAAEGAVGLYLLREDKENAPEDKKAPSELFDEGDLEYAGSVIGAELSHKNDGESNANPRLNVEIPRDEEASEDDFL